MAAGVYFLVNDVKFDWLIVFLQSLRDSNPDVPLAMIRFDERTSRCEALSGRFGFRVADPPGISRLEQVGSRLGHAGQGVRLFRKFAAFWEGFDPFVFLDVDLAVLSPLSPMIEALASGPKRLVYLDSDLEQVYRKGSLRDRMVGEFATHGFNTGEWGSRRGAISIEDVERLATEVEPSKAELMNLGEQPFLNYCADRLGLDRRHAADLVSGTSRINWAGYRHFERSGTGLVVRNASDPEDGKSPMVLHWAGMGDDWNIPYRSLFLKFRLRGEPRTRRAAFVIAWWWRGLRSKARRWLGILRHGL